jgi:hypothetical protein
MFFLASPDQNAQVLLCTKDAIYNLELDIGGDIIEIYRSDEHKIAGKSF